MVIPHYTDHGNISSILNIDDLSNRTSAWPITTCHSFIDDCYTGRNAVIVFSKYPAAQQRDFKKIKVLGSAGDKVGLEFVGRVGAFIKTLAYGALPRQR